MAPRREGLLEMRLRREVIILIVDVIYVDGIGLLARVEGVGYQRTSILSMALRKARFICLCACRVSLRVRSIGFAHMVQILLLILISCFDWYCFHLLFVH